MNTKTLRKRLNYNQVIDKYQKFEIPLPDRKATNILNHPIISNLLFDSYISDESIIGESKNIIRFDKFTQTPHTKSIQTDTLDAETQKPHELQHYELYPNLYYKIDAMSKYMKHEINIKTKNDGFAGIISTENKQLYDSIIQTSNYIPPSLKQKSDNINQTVRYMLKETTGHSPVIKSKQGFDETKPRDEKEGDYNEWYDSLRRKEPVPPIEEEERRSGLWDWLIRIAVPPAERPDPPSSPSNRPSVPSPSIRSPSETPPIYIPPSPPSSPSPVTYPVSVSSNEEEEERQSRRSSRSSKSNKK